MHLVEAESFENPGGWAMDQQFMDQMGSPVLLAHGLGVPVQDAVTAVTLPAEGKYRLWVRTREWAGARDAQPAPGKFQLLVDGQPLPVVFGAEGAAWHWQEGGTVEIRDRQVKLALHDLTGFEGRCDAILFSQQSDFVPPDRGRHWPASGVKCWVCRRRRRTRDDSISSWLAGGWRGPARRSRRHGWACR
jgi:hypothetical protein